MTTTSIRFEKTEANDNDVAAYDFYATTTAYLDCEGTLNGGDDSCTFRGDAPALLEDYRYGNDVTVTTCCPRCGDQQSDTFDKRDMR